MSIAAELYAEHDRNAHLRLWLTCMSETVSPTLLVSSQIHDSTGVLLKREMADESLSPNDRRNSGIAPMSHIHLSDLGRCEQSISAEESLVTLKAIVGASETKT
jgi:hypothetical protein